MRFLVTFGDDYYTLKMKAGDDIWLESKYFLVWPIHVLDHSYFKV